MVTNDSNSKKSSIEYATPDKTGPWLVQGHGATLLTRVQTPAKAGDSDVSAQLRNVAKNT